jgi:G:T-mismatch repair DNA endonuclease (very short patch repair protein)
MSSIFNNTPAVLARIEQRDGRRYTPLRKQLEALNIGNRRWGKIASGSPDITLSEVNKTAYLLGVDVDCILGRKEVMTND